MRHDAESDGDVSANVVLELTENLLNQGRTLSTDNYSTGIFLVSQSIE